MSEACIHSMKKLYLQVDEYSCFEDLHRLMTNNPSMTREFALHIINHVLFAADKSGYTKPQMNKSEFKKKMAAEGKYQYCLVQPKKLRQLFAEYCIINKDAALADINSNFPGGYGDLDFSRDLNSQYGATGQTGRGMANSLQYETRN